MQHDRIWHVTTSVVWLKNGRIRKSLPNGEPQRYSWERRRSSPDLPEVFSTFFSSSKIPDIRAKLDQTTFQQCVLELLLAGSPLTEFQPVLEPDIVNILKTMSLNSCELDPIPASVFFHIPPGLVQIITDAMKASLLAGSVSSSNWLLSAHTINRKSKDTKQQ